MPQIWRPDLRTFSAIFVDWKDGSANSFAFRMNVHVCYNLLPGLKSFSGSRSEVRPEPLVKELNFSLVSKPNVFSQPKVNLKFSGMAPSIPPWTFAEEEKWKPLLDDGFNCQHCQHWVMGQLLSTLQRYHLYSWLVLVQKLQSNN